MHTSLTNVGWGQYKGGAGRYKPLGTKPQNFLLWSLAKSIKTWKVSDRMSASAITAAFNICSTELKRAFASSSSIGSKTSKKTESITNILVQNDSDTELLI